VVDAATIARGKPIRRFSEGRAGAGCGAGDCLGVEDAVAGVASIKSAGMFALGIGHPFVLTEADVVITSLSEFNLAAY
jgi:beta-phosphoglucomutase